MTIPRALEVAIHLREVNGATVAFVAASGEIDLSNSESLAAALNSRACTNSGGIVIDLRDVPFMDSSGLAVILRCARSFDSRLAILVAERSQIARLLEIANVDPHVPVLSEESAAAAAVASAKS